MKKAIFSGSSHFQGLGLEFELSNRYTSKDWLDENGVHCANEQHYIAKDYLIFRNHRWSSLISKKLGVQEWNVCLNEKDLGHGLDLEFFDLLLNKKIDVTNVSYIFQEFNLLSRLRYELEVYTPTELLKVLEDNKIDSGFKDYIKKWLDDNDSGRSLEVWIDKFYKVKKMYPNIKFYIIDWSGIDFNNIKEQIPNDLLYYVSKKSKKSFPSFMNGLEQDKLLVTDSSYCYTSNNRTWNITWWDVHANKEGNEYISEMLFKQINKTLT